MTREVICPVCNETRTVRHRRYTVHICRPCSARRANVRVWFGKRWQCPTGELREDTRARSWAQWGWLAGILDGEGCFQITRDGRSVAIRVGMTDEATIRKCAEIYGAGKVAKRILARKKPLYSWSVYSHDARELAWLVLPFLTTKRQIALQMIEGR